MATMLNGLIVFCLVSVAVSLPFRLKTLAAHDPDDDIPTCQLAASKGYPCEQYNVTTSDGYILTVHRIPYGVKSPGNVQSPGKPVVYMQHGLLDCSATWVINFPNESLAFLMADAGYDVWLGNMRGNTYGMAHVKYTTKQHEFWQFTFDEMAKFDLPAIVEYALAATGQPDLYYVGHSQGTLIGFIQFSQDPSWAKSKIKQFHALAPIAWLEHTTSPIRLIAPFANDLGFILELLGADEFLPSTKFMEWLGGVLCDPPFEFLCENVLMLIAGYDSKNMNATRNSVYMTHAPAGTSTYNVVHFAQLIDSKKFQAMDWGYFDNEKYYGQHSPPQYYPNTMTVPTALYWGDIDEFADPTDVAYLQTQIDDCLIGSYRYPDMDHLDFVWGMNAPKEPYPQLMQLVAADVANSKK
jgi:pimeloyl-ACP methyl ester carboxylesterase